MNILCIGGCDNDLTPLLKLIKNVFHLIKILGPIILLIVAVIFLIRWATNKSKKDKPKKNYLKKAISTFIIAVVVFAGFSLGEYVLFKILPYDYDTKAQCWCSK